MADYPRGIDVSNNNGAIDWGAVAGSGVGFAIAKASEGTYFRDGWFAENWSACKMYSIARGAYHYAVPSETGPEGEADYFLSAISLLYGELEAGDLLALDLEDPRASGDLSDWTLRWLQRVEQAAGFRPMVYTSPSYANEHGLYNQPALGQYGLWLASWGVPTPPPAPLPWRLVAIHQIGIGPAGSVPGVAGACDLNRFNGSSVEQLMLYGKPASSVEPEPEPTPPPSDLPVYNWQEPSHPQENDWSCSQDAAEWALWAYGRTPDDDWMEQSMMAAGVIDPAVGLTDASGAGLAAWLNAEYGEFGYVASNDDPVSFDDVAAEAATLEHPLMIGGRGWYHWSGCANYDPSSDVLILRNPSPGWMDVGDTMTRWQFDELGPFSLVRLTHPAAEADDPPPDPEPEPDPPTTGAIGSGLLEMMDADGTEPAQRDSLWLPPAANPAEIEICFGQNGTIYAWLFAAARGFRYQPA